MAIFTCKACGKQFKRRPAALRAGYCSHECGYQQRRGIKFPQEWIDNMRRSKMGHPVTLETRKKISLAQKGKKRSQEYCENVRLANNRPEVKEKQRLAKTGPRNPMWSGGRYTTSEGYIMRWKPNHPLANNRGMIPEHRLIAEGVLGRYLGPTEIVHHVDLDRTNNAPGNLIVMGRGEHMRYHQNLNRLFEHWVGA